VPGTDPNATELRTAFQPLNAPPAGADPALAAAAKEASVNAFHLAALVGVGLLLGGAAVNWAGLRAEDDERAARSGAPPEGAAAG
jgi:hypothetical protein